MQLRVGQFGLRWQSEAATPLFARSRNIPKRRGASLPTALQNRGFTLVELILILALLVIITSLAAPGVANFIRGRALDSEGRRLYALIHEGQSRAVSEGMPMVLWVDVKRNTYGLQEETPGKNGDPEAETLTLDSTLKIAVQNGTVVTPTTFNNLPAIRFQPGGTVDINSPQVLQLTDSAGVSLWLVEAS
ncbi:MAG TPA: GspH/FimT family pseudopilin, partial [Candidatus Paceibacterota bacterium]|nr:GspH/FimT family pseudopilin [Candidatus Paceibacterota bacterium]